MYKCIRTSKGAKITVHNAKETLKKLTTEIRALFNSNKLEDL